MRWFIGTHRHDSLGRARGWFGTSRELSVFEPVAKWAELREPTWGECFLFVEVDIPGHVVPGIGVVKATNADLIIAFGSHLAVVEVKGYESVGQASKRLTEDLRQTATAAALMAANLNSREDLVSRPILYYSNLDSDAVETLKDRQMAVRSLRRICLAGGIRCARKPRLEDGYPVFLPEVLEKRLAPIAGPPNSSDSRFQERIRDIVGPSSLRAFDSLSAAHKELRTETVDIPLQIRPEPNHVYGCWDSTLKRAFRRLGRYRVVEIVGAPRSGKSAFIRELLTAKARVVSRVINVAKFVLTPQSTLRSVGEHILEELGLPATDSTPTSEIYSQLHQHSVVMWLSSYPASRQDLARQLISQFRDRNGRSQLVLESWLPLEPGVPHSVQLPELDDRRLLRILRERRPGNPRHDALAIVNRAFGNPGLALDAWLSSDAQPRLLRANRENGLIAILMSNHRPELIEFVADLLYNSPIGVDTQLLQETAAGVFEGIPTRQVREELGDLIDTMARTGLVMFHQGSTRVFELWRESLAELSPQVRPLFHQVTMHATGDDWLEAALDERASPSLENIRLRTSDAFQSAARFSRSASHVLELRNGRVSSLLLSPWLMTPFVLTRVIAWLDRRRRGGKDLSQVERRSELYVRLIAARQTDALSNEDIFGELKRGPVPIDDPLPSSMLTLALASQVRDRSTVRAKVKTANFHSSMEVGEFLWALFLTREKAEGEFLRELIWAARRTLARERPTSATALKLYRILAQSGAVPDVEISDSDGIELHFRRQRGYSPDARRVVLAMACLEAGRLEQYPQAWNDACVIAWDASALGVPPPRV